MQKPTGQLLAAMQVNLYELYSTYLVNIFATLNNLNLKIQECNQHIIAFYSSMQQCFQSYTKVVASIKNMVFFLTLNDLLSEENLFQF